MGFDISAHMSGELHAVRETRRQFGSDDLPFRRLEGVGRPELDVAADTINPPELVWRRNPVEWSEQRANIEIWSKQREIFRSVVTHSKTAVHSSHSVGKSFSAAMVSCWWLDVHPPGEAFVLTCYTDDTEVLTKDGWKLFQDVKVGPEGDLFATRRIGSGEFEWQHATRSYRAPWDGEIVDVKGLSLHLRVTGNHRMLTQWSTYKDGVRTIGETIKRADAIHPTRGAQLPALSTWEGKTPETVTFGRYTWATEDFAAFLGAWLAEGSLGVEVPRVRATRRYKNEAVGSVSYSGGPISLTQLPHTKGYEPYRELLIRMLGREPTRSGNSWRFNCKDLYRYLQKLGKAHEKYIPTEVKDWGTPALEVLLHYYLLGDGWSQDYQGKKRTSTSWRSCTVSKHLADDLQEIAQKTGRYATIRKRSPRDGGVLENGRKILAENCRDAYYLIFGSTRARGVKTSRSHYTGDVYCVSVPNEILYVRRGGSPIWCGNTAPTDVQVKAILWREINKLHAKLGLRGRTNLSEWYIGNELVALGRKPSEHNPTGLHGIHNRYFLVVIDEGCGVPKPLWDAASTLVANEYGRMLAIGNPDDPQSEFARVCKPDSGWNVIHIGTDDTPNFTGEEVSRSLSEMLPSQAWKEDRKKAWGEDSAIYISKVLGLFPQDDDPYTTIPFGWASRCRYTEFPEDESEVQAGIDIGAGGDRTVIYERRGRVAGRVAAFRDADPMRTVGKLVEKIHEWGVTKVKVDVIGIGWGLYGNLRQSSSRHNPVGAKQGETTHGAEVVPVNFSSSPSQLMQKRFANKRAEVWWNVGREYSRLQTWDLTRVSDDTIVELTSPRYEILDAQGKIKIEAKEHVKSRIGRSPDMADALLLAFYEPGFQSTVSSAMSGTSSLASTDLLKGLRPI
jgi:hypothetical protein